MAHALLTHLAGGDESLRGDQPTKLWTAQTTTYWPWVPLNLLQRFYERLVGANTTG
ncbi:hypothetical protein VDGD_20067 [Verticillium dahliae]|nr:hypothetical protein VDGD_20067 [Verticillium dahliae]